MRPVTLALLTTAIGLSACAGPNPRPYSTFLFDQDLPAATTEFAALESGRCRVYFDLDSAHIRSEQMGTIERCARTAAGENVLVAVAGHADERGEEGYNLKLGEQRARAVAQALGQRGVPQERISIVSYGELRPMKQGEGEETWSVNRRVDIARQPAERAQ